MVFLPILRSILGGSLLFIGKDKGSRRGLARMFAMMRRFDAACSGRLTTQSLHLFPPHRYPGDGGVEGTLD
jgi:hypothetical protein